VLLLILTPTISVAENSSHREAAIRLIEVTNTQKLLDQIMDSVGSMMERQFRSMDLPQEGLKAAEEVQKEIMVWFSDFFQWDEMKKLYADIYTEVFTENELVEMIAFYQTPLGKKMLAKMPELMQKSMEKTQTLLRAKMPELQNRMKQKITELERKYRK
jgi:hypothetical protein